MGIHNQYTTEKLHSGPHVYQGFPLIKQLTWVKGKSTKRFEDKCQHFPKKTDQRAGLSEKKMGGEGYLSNFPKNNVGNLKVWEEVKKEIHKQKLRRVGHLSKKTRGRISAISQQK